MSKEMAALAGYPGLSCVMIVYICIEDFFPTYCLVVLKLGPAYPGQDNG